MMLVMGLVGCVYTQCYTRRSIRDGSFFTKSKITLQKWMILIHYWVQQYPVTAAAQDAGVDKCTAIDAYQWLREICSSSLLRAPQIILGGQGAVVQVDEYKVLTRLAASFSSYTRFFAGHSKTLFRRNGNFCYVHAPTKCFRILIRVTQL